MADEELTEFIDEEELKMNNLESGLTLRQRVRLLPKIKEIEFLLGLLKSGGLPKKEQKEIEKAVEKATDKVTEDSKAEQLRAALDYSFTRRVKPNISVVPEDVRQKALMVKASKLYDTTNGDKDAVDSFLDDNEIPFAVDDELSTGEGLVLVERTDPKNIKMAYRGSKMDSLKDWTSNAKILQGAETQSWLENSFNEAADQVKAVKAKYGVDPSEYVGHSRGGTIAMTNADRFGGKSTTFNPFLGNNLIHSQTTKAEHDIYRTTEDLPSLGLGFRNETENYKINTLRPLRDKSGALGAHRLDNFIDDGARAQSSVLEDRANELMTATKRAGEARFLTDMANHAEGRKVDHVAGAKQFLDKLVPEGQQANTTAAGSVAMLDTSMPTQTDLDLAYERLGDIDQMRFGDEGLDMKTRTMSALGVEPMRVGLSPAQEARQSRTDIAMRNLGELLGKPKPKPEPTEPSDADLLRQSGRDFTSFMKGFSPADVDALDWKRLSSDSPHVQAWDELTDGGFTQAEQMKIDATDKAAATDENRVPPSKFSLDESERQEIYDASPEEREQIVKQYEDQHSSALENMDSLTTEPTTGENLHAAISGAANPLNLGVGLVAGYSANKLLDIVDPDLPDVPKQVVGGALGGGLSELGIARLGGEAATTAGLATGALSGGIGALAGYEAYKGLKAEGASDLEAVTGSGAAAGLGSALASGGAAVLGGAELGTAFAPETLGASTLVGAGIGAASFAASEEDSAIKNALKKRGYSDFESGMMADTATGASIGGAAGLVAGGPVGALIGSGLGATVGSMLSAGQYLVGKLF